MKAAAGSALIMYVSYKHSEKDFYIYIYSTGVLPQSAFSWMH